MRQVGSDDKGPYESLGNEIGNAQMAKLVCSSCRNSRKQIFLPWRSSQDLTNKFISSIVI